MALKQKQGGALKTTIHAPPTGTLARGDNSFDMRRNEDRLLRKKPKKPPHEVYDPSQPLDFDAHIKPIAAEGDELLGTVQKETQAHTAINVNYRRLIDLLTETNHLSLDERWGSVELRVVGGLDQLLDRTIWNMNQGGYDNLPALFALKQEVHARVNYLMEQHPKAFKEKTASHLDKVIGEKTRPWEKGH